MGLFVSSKALARRHGVYAIEATPPAVIKPTGFGTAAIVEQFPWGPSQTLTTPVRFAELLQTVAPPGMSRIGAGYLAIIRKAFSTLKFVRVTGTSAATATATINKSGPTACLVVTLKYVGSAGNSVTITIGPASDGNSNHFNLSATVTGATGTTTDLLENLNVSGVGADVLPTNVQLANALLIGSVTKSATGIPLTGSTSCSGGTDGTITSPSYVGTQGANDQGFAKLEGDKTIDHVFTGDPGNSLRAAVNAGAQAHADYMSDRVAYINGNSGQAASDAQTDVANYRSERVVYCDPWVFITDDTDGTQRLVPGAPFAASVGTQTSPSTPIAWKSAEIIAMLSGIVDLEADRGEAAADNTDAGIATFIREDDGGFTIEADVVTIAPSDPALQDLTRTRMGHYMGRSITKSLRPKVDAPNVPVNQQDCIDACTVFLEKLKANQGKDPNHTPHILDYDFGDPSANNPQSDLDAGDFTIPIDAKTSTGMKRIFLNFNFGPTVNVTSGG